MAVLAQSKARYLRSPALRTVDGEVVLTVVAWEGSSERLLRFRLAEDGSPIEPAVAGPERPAIVTLDPRDHGEASASAVELEAVDGDARVTISHGEGVSTVRLTRGDRTVDVFRARGIAVSPAVALARDGAWVAFHTDVREDTGEPDVAKWIVLRFVDASGAVFEPNAEMRDRDRDREGVEQSFEMPALVVGDDGSVALFGRGSHNFYRQDLCADGFSDRKPLSDGEWGSRGRRISACARADGRVVVARRDKPGIVVDLLEPVTGGAPSLRPAAIDANDARPSTGRTPRPELAARWELRTYFGDIQQHSAHSDGVGTADEAYLRARDRYGDDFVALTDHEAFLGKRTGPGEWEYLQDVADRYEEPGRFASLLAYEWTGARFPGPGHKCVYVPERGLPLLSRDVLPKGRDLVDELARQGGLASPHHIGWTGCDEPAHDELTTPVWEICSCHGCYEHADHPLGQRGDLTDQLADVMLRRGHRFGFTASSDSHGLLYHHGEARKRDPYRTGLTAVQAPSLDRASVLEALRNRRCYATSGVKIALDVAVNGAPMGSFLAGRAPLSVDARCVGVGELERVDLVGPDSVLASFACEGREASVQATVDARFVYVRVVQRDGEMAWSSPVFREA